MPSTDSLTGSAGVVGTPSAVLTDPLDGSVTLTPTGFFRVRATAAGVTVSKASSLAGAQAALSFPITRNQAVELGQALLQVAG